MDTPTLTLETRILQFISTLEGIAPSVRERRLAKERQDKIDEENARNLAIFLRQERQLKADLDSYEQALRLRELACHIRSQCNTAECTAERDALLRWLEWVERMADEKDPAAKGVRELLKRYEMEF